jgi:apolipoprotein D and lipocalin family protein
MTHLGACWLRLVVCLLVLAGLAACVTAPESPGLRNINAPISSQVDVTAARMAGDWVIRRSWPGSLQLAAQDPALRFTRAEKGLRVSGGKRVGDSAGNAVISPFSTELEARGPGRFRDVGGKVFGAAELWVLWMDADDRTMAIGTPGGAFGWVMDRRANGGHDRIKAASEIMEWMGYDLSQARG